MGRRIRAALAVVAASLGLLPGVAAAKCAGPQICFCTSPSSATVGTIVEVDGGETTFELGQPYVRRDDGEDAGFTAMAHDAGERLVLARSGFDVPGKRALLLFDSFGGPGVTRIPAGLDGTVDCLGYEFPNGVPLERAAEAAVSSTCEADAIAVGGEEPPRPCNDTCAFLPMGSVFFPMVLLFVARRKREATR